LAHSPWCFNLWNNEGGLASNFINWSFIREFSNKLISLDVYVLLSWRCFGSLDVSCEKFFSSLRSFLLKSFGIVFLLVSFKKLVRIGARRNDHSSISRASEYSSVIHDVLRNKFTFLALSIKLVLLVNYTGVSTLETVLSSLLALHHFIQII
jgi:hypothetical protein